MTTKKSNITELHQPRCIWCGKSRAVEDLNGYDPLAPITERYKKAYCKRLADCDSTQARQKMDDLINKINKE